MLELVCSTQESHFSGKTPNKKAEKKANSQKEHKKQKIKLWSSKFKQPDWHSSKKSIKPGWGRGWGVFNFKTANAMLKNCHHETHIKAQRFHEISQTRNAFRLYWVKGADSLANTYNNTHDNQCIWHSNQYKNQLKMYLGKPTSRKHQLFSHCFICENNLHKLLSCLYFFSSCLFVSGISHFSKCM